MCLREHAGAARTRRAELVARAHQFIGAPTTGAATSSNGVSIGSSSGVGSLHERIRLPGTSTLGSASQQRDIELINTPELADPLASTLLTFGVDRDSTHRYLRRVLNHKVSYCARRAALFSAAVLLLSSCSNNGVYDTYFSAEQTDEDILPQEITNQANADPESTRRIGSPSKHSLYLYKQQDDELTCLLAREPTSPHEWASNCVSKRDSTIMTWRGVQYSIGPDEPKDNNFDKVSPNIYVKDEQ